MARKEPDWKPRRRGAIYCSPACGAGCTKADFDDATERARLTCEALGPGWKPHVWENLRWHAQAIKGQMGAAPLCEVTIERPGIGYRCSLQTNPQFVTRSRSPRAAVRRALEQLRARTADLLLAAREIEL
jgi:hypothetical protein